VHVYNITVLYFFLHEKSYFDLIKSILIKFNVDQYYNISVMKYITFVF